MSTIEQSPLDPNEPYEDIQGERPSDEVPRRVSMRTLNLIHSRKEFKKALKEPRAREIVANAQKIDMVVGAKYGGSTIIFDIAKHRNAIIAGGAVAAGVAAATGYHFFRKRRKGQGE